MGNCRLLGFFSSPAAWFWWSAKETRLRLSGCRWVGEFFPSGTGENSRRRSQKSLAPNVALPGTPAALAGGVIPVAPPRASISRSRFKFTTEPPSFPSSSAFNEFQPPSRETPPPGRRPRSAGAGSAGASGRSAWARGEARPSFLPASGERRGAAGSPGASSS